MGSDKAVPAEVGSAASGSHSGISAPSAFVKQRRNKGHSGGRGWQHVGPSGLGSDIGVWSIMLLWGTVL